MKTEFYLHVRENGATRTTKHKSTNHIDEISIAMELELPDRLFEKPIISGKIVVDESMVSPKTINAEVEQQIKNAIESVDSVKIELKFPEQLEE